MSQYKIFLGIVLLLIGSGIILSVAKTFEKSIEKKTISNYAECVEAGYPIQESYPPQCKTPDGKTFTEDVGNKVEKQGLIQVDEPFPNQIISSPITIIGKARGYWYFEASFPLELRDANGVVLASSYIQADGEWMTEDFVPFIKELTFETPTTDTGILILHKDNPSGLPEHDDALYIPVAFSKKGGIARCVPAGCSGQLCVEQGFAGGITTCEFRAEYACYQNAKCERQRSGECGWTPTSELSSCLQNPPALQ